MCGGRDTPQRFPTRQDLARPVRWSADPYRAEIWMMAALGLALRALAVDSTPYGDEAAHFSVARTLGLWSEGVYWLYGREVLPAWHLSLGRPLFYLGFFLPGQVSFEAFRWANVGGSVAIFLVADRIARLVGTPGGPRILLAASLALLAPFVVWGVRVFPDTWATVFVLLAIERWLAGRPWWAVVFGVAALWTKEAALFALLPLACLWLLRQPSRRTLVQAVVLFVVGLSPLVAYLALGSAAPGWGRGGPVPAVLDTVFLSVWLGVLLLGLLVRGPRGLAWVAAGTGALFLLHRLARGASVEAWYAVLPAALVLLALFSGFGRTDAKDASTARRIGLAATTLVVASLAFAPTTAPWSDLQRPLSEGAWATVPDAVEGMHEDPEGLGATVAHLEAKDTTRLLTVDVPWFYVAWPLGATHDETLFVFTWLIEAEGLDPGAVWDNMTRPDTTTVLGTLALEHNERLRARAAPCQTFETSLYHVYDGACLAERTASAN